MDHSLPVSPWPEWEIVSKIGEGSYGCVYKASRVEQGHAFFSAIKVISIVAIMIHARIFPIRFFMFLSSFSSEPPFCTSHYADR